MVFDPSKLQVGQLLDAVNKAGYRPSREGAVAATLEQAGVKAEAATSVATLEQGKSGKVKVSLTLPQELKDSAWRVVASGDGLQAEASGEGKPGQKELELPIGVKADAKKGEHQVELTIRVERADAPVELRLRVPVYVE